MSGSRGQASIEALFVVPACVLCALVVVEAGVAVRSQLALNRAAADAGVAALEGSDPQAAAVKALRGPLARTAHVRVANGRVRVQARPNLGILRAAGPVVLSSTVEVGEVAS